MRATDGNSQMSLLRASGIRWPSSAIVVASVIFAFAIGVFLVVRRLNGALTAPLPAPQLVATATGLCVWAMIVRQLAAKRPAFAWLLPLVVLVFAIGCSYPVNRLVDWLVWLPAIGFVSLLPLTARIHKQHSASRRSPRSDGGATDDRILQQLTRVRAANGNDAIRGTLVAEFAPGERQNTLYVGFCPPFETLPQVELNVADDSQANVKLAQVLHNGAQLEVRLSEPAEDPLAVSIELFAVETRYP